jgi:hypothetical protein
MSETPLDFKAARKRAADARSWKYSQQYEDGLAAIERNPAVEGTLSADHRSCLWYYKWARDAAVAEGIDVTGGSR